MRFDPPASFLPSAGPFVPTAPPPARGPASHERLRRLAARLLRVPVARVVMPHETPLGRVARRVVRRQMSLIVPDVRRAPSSVADAAVPAGWGAMLAVPIPALRAALVVADTVAREWRDDDVAALTDLVAALAGPRPPEAPAWLRRMVRFEVHEARRKSEARLALIFDSTMDFIVLAAVERDGFRCSAANEACLAVTGLTATQVLGRRMEEVLGGATWARVLPRVITAARHGEPLRWEEEFPLLIGRATLETTLTPILDDAGRCTHLLAVSRDVTARARAEDALRAAIGEAQAARLAAEGASRDRGALLARLGSELREPLGALAADARRGDQGALDRVAENGERLLACLDRLLELGRSVEPATD